MSTAKNSHIYLVDDDASFRASLKEAFSSLGYQVHVFESADAFLEYEDIAWPAVLVSDVRMPGKSGVQMQQSLVDANFEIPIVFISGEITIHEVISGMKLGAIDFLQKPFAMEALVATVEKALERQRVSLAKSYKAIAKEEKLKRLAPREREVCDLIVLGHTNPKIAFQLYLSIETVKQYKKNIYQKLAIEDLAGLIALMRQDN